MNISSFFANTLKLIKTNSPEILTALGVSGVVTTAYLASKASVNAHEDLSGHHNEPLKDQAKLVWKLYIPTGISGALTIACIIGASKGNNRRTAAAVTAYSITERAFSEYREKSSSKLARVKRKHLETSCYRTGIWNLSSEQWGVAQTRRRLFLAARRSDTDLDVQWRLRGSSATEPGHSTGGTNAWKMTVAETARLQAFPDGHPFVGTNTSQFRQVGNACPTPLALVTMAEALDEDWTGPLERYLISLYSTHVR